MKYFLYAIDLATKLYTCQGRIFQKDHCYEYDFMISTLLTMTPSVPFYLPFKFGSQ